MVLYLFSSLDFGTESIVLRHRTKPHHSSGLALKSRRNDIIWQLWI